MFDKIRNRDDVATATVDLTIKPVPEPLDPSLVPSLPLIDIAAGTEGGSVPHFRPDRVAGRGGMGVVHMATQTGMSRVVALKSVTAAQHTLGVPALLREAQVMAYLEHPNIVPVHVIGHDAANVPHIAMKFVEGRSLQDWLSSKSRDFEFIVDTLVSVSQALSFAHSRGILHLDIKPANIMLGDYGEVYLLDWGAALAFRDDVHAGVPHVRDLTSVVGTPAYLAPEMISLELPLGPYTDIFLLGGTLYAMLTGRSPNLSSTSTEALAKSYRGEIEPLPEDLPSGLVQICLRALARRPADRFGSVEEFRAALLAWKRTSGQERILASAQRRLGDLWESVRGSGRNEVDVYRLYGATRHAFEEVSELPDATPGLQSCLEAMIEFELARSNPGAAQAFLHELPQHSGELARRVADAQALQRQRLDKADQFEAIERDTNPLTSSGAKAALWFAIGITLAVPQLVLVAMGSKATTSSDVKLYLGFALVLVTVFVAMRKRLFGTSANRRLSMAVGVLVSYALLLRVGASAGWLSLETAVVLDLTLVAVLSLYGAFNIDRRIALVVPGYFLGALTTWFAPQSAFVVFPITHLLNMLVLSGWYLKQWRVDRQGVQR